MSSTMRRRNVKASRDAKAQPAKVIDAAEMPQDVVIDDESSGYWYSPEWWFRPVPSIQLAVFRLLFGFVMMYEFWSMVRPGGRLETIEGTYVNFKYKYFEWVQAPSDMQIVYQLCYLGMLASAFMSAGFLPRLSSAYCSLCYAYVFFLEETQYNNHYYLIMMVCTVFVFIDAWRPVFQTSDVYIERWNIALFRILLAVVYFYAGVAKMNEDWLFRALPLKIWMTRPDRRAIPILGNLISHPLGYYSMAWIGMLFDTFVGIGLLIPSNAKGMLKQMRNLSIASSLFFHSVNNVLFSIGVFPTFMVFTTVLFLDANVVRDLLMDVHALFKPRRDDRPAKTATSAPDSGKTAAPAKRSDSGRMNARRWLIYSVIMLFLLVQVLLPLRHWVIEGPVVFTEEGHTYSWRMKLRMRRGTGDLLIVFPDGTELPADVSKYVNPSQQRKVLVRPYDVYQLAHYIANLGVRRWNEAAAAAKSNELISLSDMKVFARVNVSVNGRDAVPMIDPSLNLLAEQPFTFLQHSRWIMLPPADYFSRGILPTYQSWVDGTFTDTENLAEELEKDMRGLAGSGDPGLQRSQQAPRQPL